MEVQIHHVNGAFLTQKRVAQCKVQELSAVSCAKTGEPIDKQFGVMDLGESKEACVR